MFMKSEHYIDKIISQINKEDNIDSLMNLYENVLGDNFPIIRYVYGTNSKLIRCRINQKDKRFVNVSELTYPQADLLKSFGRANIPGQPMFYACSFPQDQETYPPRLVGVMESSSFYRDLQSEGRQRITCSLWTNNRPLSLVVLPFSADYARACDDVVYIREQWENATNTYLGDDYKIKLLEYMGQLLSIDMDDETCYKNIASFINYLMFYNKKTKTADGILYPSVKAAGNSFNMALKPKVADEVLSILGGGIMHLIKNKDDCSLLMYQHFNVDKNLLLYRERTSKDKKEYNYFNRKYKYLPLIN